MTEQQDRQYRAGLAINAIVDLVDEEPEVTGGGRGWTATVGEYEAKSTSKAEALEALLALLVGEGAANEDNDLEGEDDEDGCSEECRNAKPDSPCSCKCQGRNHPGAAVVLGDKPCQCGCGQVTKRRFVPGHDARFHFAERAAKAGVTPEELRKSLKKERNAKAAAKRREQRAYAKSRLEALAAEKARIAADLEKVGAEEEAKAATN